MSLFPDSTGHPEISRRSGDFPAERTEGSKAAFSGAAFSRFRLLAGGCGGWLEGLKRLKIKKTFHEYLCWWVLNAINKRIKNCT